MVARFEGFVARYMGDGVLVYFGYPQAHEDDPERAIRAGLAIVEAVSRSDTIAGPAGTLSPASASRAGSWSSAISLVRLLSRIRCRRRYAKSCSSLANCSRPRNWSSPNPLGALREACSSIASSCCRILKGRGGPERAWMVLGESVIDSRFEALRRGRLHLVGRTEELELLLRRWGQAKAGEGRVVLLRGEPGMGKSRLIVELEQEVIATPHSRLRFLCSPHHHDTPLHPVIRQIERAANFQRGDSPEAKWDKLATTLRPTLLRTISPPGGPALDPDTLLRITPVATHRNARKR